MADETQNAPVASAENATKPTKLFVYYYSDPDGATKEDRCHTVFTEVPFDVVPWRMHKEAPADSLEDPVWDDNLNNGLGAWKENSGNAQGQILAAAQAKLDELNKKSHELDQANGKVDNAVKAVQQAQQLGAQQSQMLTKSLAKLMESQDNTNKLIMTMQKSLLTVAQGNKTTNTSTSDNK